MLYTVGHSNRTLDQLVEVLRAHGIARLVDVRRFPGSRRHPHFARASLEQDLPAAGIAYEWVEALGGHREPRDGSPHTALEPGVAGYADYMETAAFADAAAALIETATATPTAVMCAEAKPEHCHRRLLSDWLVACAGQRVLHLLSATDTRPHRVSEVARVVDGRLRYDRGQLSLT